MKKLSKSKALCYTLMIFAFSGCNSNNIGGVANNTAQVTTNLARAQQLSVVGQAIPQVNLYDLDYNILDLKTPISKCSANSQVCFSLNNEPYAVFTYDAKGERHWLMKNYLAKLHITFNDEIKPDFHLVHVDHLNIDPQRITGNLTQIDSSNCDELMTKSNGKLKNQSCDIKFTYTGKNFDSTLVDNFEFYFAWKSADSQADSLQFNIHASNQQIASELTPNISLLEDAKSESITTILPKEAFDGSMLNYPINDVYSFSLVNYGKSLPSIPDIPTIDVKLGQYQDGKNASFRLDYDNYLVTSCGSNSIANQGTCKFSYSIRPTSSLASELNGINNFIVFSYLFNGRQVYNVQPVVHSFGEIIHSDYQISSFKQESQISISIAEPGGDSIAYRIPLQNIKFYLKYAPEFSVSEALIRNTHGAALLRYSVGNINDETQTPADLINSITIRADNNNCFTGNVDPNVNDILESSDHGYFYRQCNLNFALGQLPPLDRPLAYQLYADYDSPIENRHISQWVGNLLVMPNTNN